MKVIIRTTAQETQHCHYCTIHVKTTEVYRVIRNDCRGFNNLSFTVHLR